MNSLESLWEYQSTQLTLEEYEQNLINTPTRQKLVKLKRFLQASQKQLAELESTSRVDKDRISEFETKKNKYMVLLDDYSKDIGYYSECETEELTSKNIQNLVKDCERLYENIVSIKKQLAALCEQFEANDKKAKETLQKMKKAKAEFNELKEKYDSELKTVTPQLDGYKKSMEKAKKKVDASLLKEYERIKEARPNPVAIFKNSRCGGCNMQLPSSIGPQILTSNKVVECENCGRILFIPQE